MVQKDRPPRTIRQATDALWEDANMEKTVKFKIEKETKNTVKYSEVPDEGQPPIIGTLYVQKWFAGNTTDIEVTIRKP